MANPANRLLFAVSLTAAGALAGCDAAAPPPTQTEPEAAVMPQTDQTVSVHVFNDAGELVGPVESPKVDLTEAQWRERLTPDQFRILRKDGTEAPFCGTLLDNKQEGVYACAGCGLPLFTSDSKFKSGTGWPSFFQPIAAANIHEIEDRSHGMVRTEIECARCGGHLGHVFPDGPKPTGLRYCVNSESLTFTESGHLAQLADTAAK